MLRQSTVATKLNKQLDVTELRNADFLRLILNANISRRHHLYRETPAEDRTVLSSLYAMLCEPEFTRKHKRKVP